VHNNSAKAQLDFVVVSDLNVFLDGLVNYPNPVGFGGTTFRFEHNQACVALKMSMHIYDSQGTVVWQGERTETPAGYQVDGWHWDGASSGGSPLRAGTYLYRLDIETPEGRRAAKTGRLVLLH
jgi:flagellar hook assembly protein FlgD